MADRRFVVERFHSAEVDLAALKTIGELNQCTGFLTAKADLTQYVGIGVHDLGRGWEGVCEPPSVSSGTP